MLPASLAASGVSRALVPKHDGADGDGGATTGRYLSFELCGGLTNQRLALLDALLIAHATGRRAVLPRMVLNGTQDARNGYAMDHAGDTAPFHDFFDVETTAINLAPHVQLIERMPHGTPRKVQVYTRARRLDWYSSFSSDAWLQLDCAYAAVNKLDRAERHNVFWALEQALVPSQLISESAGTIAELLRARSLELGGDGHFTALHLRVERDWVAHCMLWEEGQLRERRNCRTNSDKLLSVFEIERVPTTWPVFVAAELHDMELWQHPGLQRLGERYDLYSKQMQRRRGLSMLSQSGKGETLGARDEERRGSLALKRSSRELTAAIDLEVCKKAKQFIGNSVSTLSAWELMRRGRLCGVHCKADLRSSFHYNGGAVPLVEAMFGDGAWGGRIPPRLLKWVFTTSAASSSDYLMMARVAVDSALKNTNLQPVLVFDGNSSHDIARWMATRAVPVVYHQPAWLAQLQKSHQQALAGERDLTQSSPLFQSLETMAATWMRIDIPRLGFVDEFILYSDIDVMFTADIAVSDFAAGGRLPGVGNDLHYIVGTEAGRSEATDCCEKDGSRVDYGNAGVMLMHVERMRSTNDEFVAWIFTDENLFEKKLHFGVYGPQDQGAYNAFYQGRFEVRTDPLFNWKPYWGFNALAGLVHFHGPKPYEYLAHAGRACQPRTGPEEPVDAIVKLMDVCLTHASGCMRYVAPWVQFAKASVPPAAWTAKLDAMVDASQCSHPSGWVLDRRVADAPGQFTGCPDGQRNAAEGECLAAVQEAVLGRPLHGLKKVNEGTGGLVPAGCSYSHASNWALFNSNPNGRSSSLYELVCIKDQLQPSDLLCYAARYPDLAAAFGNDTEALLAHWNNLGKLQGRDPYCLSVNGRVREGLEKPLHSSDLLCYAARYPDLADAFGDDTEALLLHWSIHGKSEGRDAYCRAAVTVGAPSGALTNAGSLLSCNFAMAGSSCPDGLTADVQCLAVLEQEVSDSPCEAFERQALCDLFRDVGPAAPLCTKSGGVLAERRTDNNNHSLPFMLLTVDTLGGSVAVTRRRPAVAFSAFHDLEAYQGRSEGTRHASNVSAAVDQGYNLGNDVWLVGALRLLSPDTVIVSAEQELNYIGKFGARRAIAFVQPAANLLQPVGEGSVTDADREVPRPEGDMRSTGQVVSIITQTVKALGLPTLLSGIGSQVHFTGTDEPTPDGYELLPADREMLRAVASTARGQPNVMVRGAFTEALIKGSARSAVAPLGCPSLLLNSLPTLGAVLESKRAAVHAMLQDEPERPLRLALTLPDGAVFFATPEATASWSRMYLSLARHVPDHFFVLQGDSDEKAIATLISHGLDVLPDQVRSFGDVEVWAQHLEDRDLLIGARIHGSMMAFYAAVPSLLVAVDVRQLELARAMHVAHVARTDPAFQELMGADEFDLAAFVALPQLQFNGTAFDERRHAVAQQYALSLESLGMQPNPRWSDALVKSKRPQ
eukprot:Transcript_25147.p1 GENE.Transcript_25147~~Transcript_25147.p1  ORF type:complete len:1461 (-),score=286.79 Transcript_25147:2270-6652(-)